MILDIDVTFSPKATLKSELKFCHVPDDSGSESVVRHVLPDVRQYKDRQGWRRWWRRETPTARLQEAGDVRR